MYGGYIYTPVDERDYGICMAFDDSDKIEIPKSYRTSFQPPYERQVAGNCAAQALANIMEVIYYKLTGEHKDFSVGFIYGNRKNGQSKSEGMSGYMACGNLCEDGDIFAEIYENPAEVPSIIKDVTEFKNENPDWKDRSFVPLCYIRTNNTADAKKFIQKYDIPVMAVCEVNDFWVGGGLHAMALYGWDDNTAIMQNSWGSNHKAKIVKLSFDEIKEFWLIVPFTLKEFPDLDKDRWSYSGIMRCVEAGIMQGYPDGTIKPEGTLTRAEFMSLLYRMDTLGI